MMEREGKKSKRGRKEIGKEKEGKGKERWNKRERKDREIGDMGKKERKRGKKKKCGRNVKPRKNCQNFEFYQIFYFGSPLPTPIPIWAKCGLQM